MQTGLYVCGFSISTISMIINAKQGYTIVYADNSSELGTEWGLSRATNAILVIFKFSDNRNFAIGMEPGGNTLKITSYHPSIEWKGWRSL